MTPAPITLELPMPPNLANARMHWRAKDRERQDYFRSCAMRVVARLVPEPPDSPPDRVRLSSVMHLGAAMDDDNAMHRHKWALDWLKQCGYIRDDKRKHLEWASLPHQVVKRDGNYRLVITLTPHPPV